MGDSYQESGLFSDPTMDSGFRSPACSRASASEKTPPPCFAGDTDAGVCARDSFDSMLCYSGSKIVPSGAKEMDFQDDFVISVNAGGSALRDQDTRLQFEGDSFFEGGDVIRTDEMIMEGGNYPSLYQSVRYGNFFYKFDALAPGDYLVDFHFAEIVNTNGPKGIRVFDVFAQEEKVLSELDIYVVVGANKPLQITDVRVTVVKDGVIAIRFEGISGSPVVCGIGIRKAPKQPESLVKYEHLTCSNCATEIMVSPTQNRAQHMKLTTKLEKKIHDLTSQYKSKNDECHEAWMLLNATNEQVERLRMELDNKLFQAETLEQSVEKHTEELRVVSERYERDKNWWAAAISDLEGKIKTMKQEQSQLSQDAHECANSIPNLNEMVIAVQTLIAQCEDLKTKYSEEVAKRKRVYNQLQEIKGNIRVFCRCRPLSEEEVSSGCSTVVDFETARDGELGVMTGGSTKKTFKFDRVYTPKDNQNDVCADASPLVTSVLDGYNVCIFAYGQTGTGKTFTMEGTERNRGVNYRTLKELFKIAGERRETFSYSISVSVLEVYNEQIRDLLATSPSTKKLEVRQEAEGTHHVPGIVEAKVANIKEVWDVLQAGSRARAVGSNNVNEHSSRSHCMLCIMVKSNNLMNGDCTKSKLWLVDLAGSERLTKTEVQGERLKEAQNINRSLSALGDVISALAMKSSHIPYRNSKLTHLLQDSLGGDSKALMFVQISPSENDLGETLSSLNFATRVRGIELGPAKKQIDTGELQKMKQMLDKAKQESRIKDESLRKLEENCQCLENKVRGKDQLCRSLQEKNKELESQLESKMELQSLSEKQHWQMLEKLKGKEEACMNLQQKVKELENKLKEQQHSESMALQQKVKELEHKLKEQRQSELVAEQKVKELEYKVREQQRSESMLEQKVMELENKLREREQSESMLLLHSAEASRIATPTDMKMSFRDESTSETNSHILRCSNSINRPSIGQGSVLLRGTESLHEMKRRRELRSGTAGEQENHMLFPTALLEKKTPMETERVRKIDPVKAFGRLTRTTKVAPTQKIFPYRKTVKEQQPGGVKERDKVRVWSR